MCDSCGKPIHWVESEQRYYHDNLNDILTCGAIVIVPATEEV